MNLNNNDITTTHTDPLNLFNLFDLYLMHWKILLMAITFFLLLGTAIFYLYPNKYEVKANVLSINSTSNNYNNLDFSKDITDMDLLTRFYREIFNSVVVEKAAADSKIIDYYSSIQEVIDSIKISIGNKNHSVSITFTSKEMMSLDESKLFVIKLITYGNNSVLTGVIQTYENRKNELLQNASVITNNHVNEINETIIRIESEVDLLFETSKELLNKRIYLLENNLRIASKLGINESQFSPELVYSGEETFNNSDQFPEYNFDVKNRNINMYLEEESETFPLYLMGVKFLEAELELKKDDLEHEVLPSSITFLNNKKKQLQSQKYRKEFIEGLRPINVAIDSVEIAINEFKNTNAETIYFDNKSMLSFTNTKVSIYIFLMSSLLIGLVLSSVIILYRYRNKSI